MNIKHILFIPMKSNSNFCHDNSLTCKDKSISLNIDKRLESANFVSK